MADSSEREVKGRLKATNQCIVLGKQNGSRFQHLPSSLPFILFSPFLSTGSHYAAQASLEFMVLLLQPPDFWDYRHVPSQVAIISFLKRIS
jgi:hypothetical protein